MDCPFFEEESCLSREAIMEGLNTRFMGREVYYFKKIASTSDLAKQLAAQGVGEGSMVISDEQCLGRGRFSRRWLSPRGGIWFSLILRPRIKAIEAYKLTFLAAVAVVKALEESFQIEAGVKWPNDVLINDKKVCGILTEVSSIGGNLIFAVLGIGINANVDVSSFPDGLSSSVTSLRRELGRDVELEDFLKVLLRNLEDYYIRCLEGDFPSILKEWKAVDCIIGRHVAVENGGGGVEGLALGVDLRGALILRQVDGKRRRVLWGKASIRGF